MMLYKKDLAKVISEKSGMSAADVKRVIEDVFDQIAFSTEKGDAVQICGFGTFSQGIAKSRFARNPKTGETFNTEEHKKMVFHPSTSLKDRVR